MAGRQDRTPEIGSIQPRLELREDGRRRDITVISAIAVLGGLFWLALHRDPVWPGIGLVIGGLLSMWYSRR